jgi:hypothetical protein
MSFIATITKADQSSRVDVSSKIIGFTGVIQHLAAGEWELELPASVWPAIAERWPQQDEAPPVFSLRWTDQRRGVLVSGPVRHAFRKRKGGDTSVTLTGVDDWAALFDGRVIWPEPANEPPWNADAYHTITAQASTAIAELVTQHVGPGARIERQVAGLSVVDEGAGEVRTWRYRLAKLEAAIADIATAEGLRVDVRRGGDGNLTVTVGPTQNCTGIVINEAKLADYSVTLSTGEETTVVAGGSGEGTSRLFAIAGREVSGAARREAFTDQRNIATQPTLEASALAHRSASSASSSLVGTLLPGVPIVWREHYELGDLLTLQVEGVRWATQVTAVTVQINPEGLRVSPVLGKAVRHEIAQLSQDVSGLGARLSSLEVS